MGVTYTNITLKGPSQDQVGDFLDRENIVAHVTPTEGDITVVYDQASSDSDEAALTTLAGKLSRFLGCVALASSVYDSDIFQYHLYLSGGLASEYNSCPDCWDDETDEIAAPAGGDAEKLCDALGVTDNALQVSKILHLYDSDPFGENAPSGEDKEDAYVFEEHRHAALVGALSLPSYVAYTGFRSSRGSGATASRSRATMRRTGPPT